MSQRRNLSYVINDLSRNPNTSNRRPRTSVLRDFNESILSKQFILVTLSSSLRIKNDVEKEHKKEESIDNEDVDV